MPELYSSYWSIHFTRFGQAITPIIAIAKVFSQQHILNRVPAASGMFRRVGSERISFPALMQLAITDDVVAKGVEGDAVSVAGRDLGGGISAKAP